MIGVRCRANTWPQVLLVSGELWSTKARERFEGFANPCQCMHRQSQPYFTVLIVCWCQQDMEDVNPLVRALALRTMSYIHVREFVEATVPPLKTLLKDPDPYVRKTAAFTVAKLYDHDRVLVEGSDLIDRLNGMLRDDNPTVVASALAALMDIWEKSETIKMTIDYTNASKIVQILPDCSE
jgi:vesicle coat complex subunit